jgi:hypothetical protein
MQAWAYSISNGTLAGDTANASRNDWSFDITFTFSISKRRKSISFLFV